MGFLGKLLRLFTPSDERMVAMATHRQLVDLLLPVQYRFGERAEQIAHLAEQRLFLEVPAATRVQLLIDGLRHKEEVVRHACAERLCGTDTPEVTSALALSLSDAGHGVKFQAALHLQFHAYHFRSGQVAELRRQIERALADERDQHVRECLEAALLRLGSG